MADERWIDDAFTQAKELRDREAIERETALRNEKRIDAQMDAFIGTLGNQVREAVEAFNARAASAGFHQAIIVDYRTDAIGLRIGTLDFTIHINRVGRKIACGAATAAVTGQALVYSIKLETNGNLTITRDDRPYLQPGEHTKDMLRQFFTNAAQSMS